MFTQTNNTNRKTEVTLPHEATASSEEIELVSVTNITKQYFDS